MFLQNCGVDKVDLRRHDAVYGLIDEIRRTIPDPPPELDTLDYREMRIQGAFAEIAAYCPETVIELRCAVTAVAMGIYSLECLKASANRNCPTSEALRWGALATSMARTSQMAARSLAKMMEDRLKREADPKQLRAATHVEWALSERLDRDHTALKETPLAELRARNEKAAAAREAAEMAKAEAEYKAALEQMPDGSEVMEVDGCRIWTIDTGAPAAKAEPAAADDAAAEPAGDADGGRVVPLPRGTMRQAVDPADEMPSRRRA